jgi:hypothetical protein
LIRPKDKTMSANKYNFAAMKVGETITKSGDDGAKLLRAAKSYADYHYDWCYRKTSPKDGTGTITIERVGHYLIPASTEPATTKTAHDPFSPNSPEYKAGIAAMIAAAELEERTNLRPLPMIETNQSDNSTWTATVAPRINWEGQPIPHWTETVGIATIEGHAETPSGEATGAPAETDAQEPREIPTGAPAAPAIDAAAWAAMSPAERFEAGFGEHMRATHAQWDRNAAERERLATLPIDETGITDVEFRLRLDARTIDAKTGKLLPNKMTYNAAIMPVWDAFATED